MINKIFVFANMGHLDELPKSGGQSSARRVMKGLENAGYKIVPIRRHRAELEGRWKHWIEVLSFAVIDLLKIFCRMAFGKRKNSALLHLSYAGPLVPYELIITLVVRMLGYKTFIYLKGGQILDSYKNGTAYHNWLFKKNMDLQNKVFFEGWESLKLVEGISDTPVVYFPNFVFENNIPPVLPERSKDTIGLLYFGRIAPNKNIDVILDTFELLCQKHDNIYLSIIGGVGQSRTYAGKIDQRIANSPYKDRITRMGITPFEKIKEIMQSHHFFVFPSQERAEGHSNSLNEAMSQGLIPIVSDYHFNRSIVGDDIFVVNGFDAINYANRIERILSNNDLKCLSEKVWRRVKDNYSYERVIDNIRNEIITI